MSLRKWSFRSSLSWLYPALIAMGCTAAPPAETLEDEDSEARVMREELTSNRGRVQFPKVGVAIPVNSELKPGIIYGIRGQIEAVDVEGGIVTMWHRELGSPDRSIWMPGMRMVFHATNRAMLRGLRPGDRVAFEAVRLRNAVMVTSIRKLP